MKFWITLLFQPILIFLTRLITSYKELNGTDNPLERYLPTISAFESLLSNTLFSGSTRSFLPSILFNKSKSDRISFELLKCIKQKNRICFSGDLWAKEELLIASDSQLLDELTKRFRVPDMETIMKTFNLLLTVKNANSHELIAELLWRSYFDLIWARYPDDFDENITEVDELKASALVLNDKVKIAARTKLTYEAAARYVFNLERNWNLPHLIAYV